MLGRGGLYYCFPIFITSGDDPNTAASSGQWSGCSGTVNRQFGVSWENSPCDILVVPALGSEVVSSKAVADVEQFSENYTKKQQKMEEGGVLQYSCTKWVFATSGRHLEKDCAIHCFRF